MWLHSSLGRRLMAGDQETVDKLSLNQSELEALRALFAKANGNPQPGERLRVLTLM